MNKTMVLATSLVSAGVASLVTAYAVEKKYIKLMDERVNAQVKESLEFLEMHNYAVKDVERTEEVTKTSVRSTPDIRVPLVDEPLGGPKNQRVRYDRVLKQEEYTEEDAPPPCDTSLEIHPITTAEFMENESGYLQSSVTYHLDGGVLDELGEVVIDAPTLIGVAPPPFGEKSGEPHIVYLRNTKLQREIEVVRDETFASDIVTTPGQAP